MRLQLVVNPVAGGGRALRALPDVLSVLTDQDVRVSVTRSLQHAQDLVRPAVADDRVVVTLGGDGLVGRVAGAVADAGGVLAVLPGGRGNDFCRATGIARDPVLASRLLLGSTPQPVDLGDAGGTPFVGIASIGFDSDVQERVLTSRVPLGRLVYLYGSLAAVARWQPAVFRCSVDGTPLTVTGWSLAVANTGVYGGGMRLAPDASVFDGQLDIVATARTTRLTFLRSLGKLFAGTHVDEPFVSVRRASSVVLDADRPFRVFADGDPVAELPCTVTVRPGALRVLLPP